MMKNLKYIKLILLLAVFVFGCNEEEFLDEAPISQVSTKSFFETSDQFEQAVNAAYSNLQNLAGDRTLGMMGAYWAMTEMRTDNSTFQNNTTDQSGHRWWDLDQFTMSAQNALVNNAWRQSYDGIGKCNIVLQYSEEKEYENKDQLVAEVKFLRGLYYFYLVCYFGDVPLVTVPAGSVNEAFEGNKRVSKDLVIDQVVADLNAAKQALPLSYTSGSIGRATEGAARILLAKVLMWRDNYGDAATELEAITQSNQYDLLDDYSSVFEISNENNIETVYSIQYIEGSYGLGSTFAYRFTPWNAGSQFLPHQQILARTGMNIPTENLLNSFEDGDLRKDMIDVSYVDHEFGTYHDSIVPFTKKFVDDGHAVQKIAGNDFALFRYPHVLLMLAECYLREGGGDPLPLVNEVRTRAGLPTLANVTLDDIIHERRIEFHCEADRWDVLVRTGNAVDVMTAHGAEERANRPEVIRGTAFEHIKLLYPIPASVLELDLTMEQNPEYE